VAKRKAFLIRIDPALYDALDRWASDELRSVNGHIEYLLNQALRQAGRSKRPKAGDAHPPSGDD
jgi:hypothetical protein